MQDLIYVIEENEKRGAMLLEQMEDLAYVIDSGNEAEWEEGVAYVIE